MSARLHEEITERIVLELEQDVVPWTKPWQSGPSEGGVTRLPRNAATGYAYRGVNILTLWAAAAVRGCPLPRWLTFRQTKERGGFVRKGERATAIVLLKRIRVAGEGEEADKDEEGGNRRREVSFLRSFAVFNVAQTEGLPERLHAPETPRPEGERHAAAEAFLGALRADVRHGGERACYVPSLDCIILPPFAAFTVPEHYYATSLHELLDLIRGEVLAWTHVGVGRSSRHCPFYDGRGFRLRHPLALVLHGPMLAQCRLYDQKADSIPTPAPSPLTTPKAAP